MKAAPASLACPTAPISFIPAEPVLEKLASLGKQVQQALDCAGEGAVYLPLRKLGERYGMSRECARRYVNSAISDGAIRVIRPKDAAGNLGDRLYHVADFEAYISRQ